MTNKNVSYARTWPGLALALILASAVSAIPLSAQEASRIDPFYQARLDEGKAFYEQGDWAASIESLRVATFGFLEYPDRLLECYVYLMLDYHGLKNEERAGYYRTEIRRLNLESRISRLGLPPAVKARYDEIDAAFARIEARAADRAPAAPKASPADKRAAETQAPAPAPPAPNVPAKMDVEKAGALVLQARAETRLAAKIALYNQALEADPSDINIYLEMNDAYYGAKKFRDAADLMQIVLLYHPQDIRVHIKLAEDTLANKAFEQAYRALVQAARIAPDNYEVRYLLGRADLGMKRYKEALAEFDFVLDRDPAFRDASALRQACAEKIK
jgi:hypothetical protein